VIRLAVKVTAGLVALLVLYLGVTFVQVWQASHRDQVHHADAIVVFGAAQYNGRPSPVLQARLDHAADLYKQKVAALVFVTGGSQPGDRATEASASAAYLKRKGVPESALLREISGRTSWQSLASAANVLKRRGKTTVVLVSDPFHNARIAAMASELGLEAYVSPTRTSPIGGSEKMRFLAKETVAVAVGRIVGFRRVSGIKSEVVRVQQRTGNG
jgi:vancomycin permeability regulator SanA